MPAVIDIARAKAIPSPCMHDGELRWLAEQASRASIVIEIGCAYGRSTRVLADHCPGRVYAVDSWTVHGAKRYPAFRTHLADHLKSGKVRELKMRSLEAAAALPNVQADFIFIDANHTYEAIRDDIAAWRERVRPGGTLSGHDYWSKAESFPGVRRAVNEAFAGRFTRHADSIWAVRL